MKKFFYGLVVFGFLFFVYQEISYIEKSNKKIKVGVVLPLSGKLAFIGKPIQNGIELYQDEFNNSKVDIIYGDSKGNAKDGLTVVNKLLNLDKVDYIIVNLTSVAMASKKLITKNKSVIGLMLSTHPNITDNTTNIIRPFISGKQESKILVDYINKNNLNNIAIVYIDDTYGEGSATFIHNMLITENKKSQKFAYNLSNLNFEPLVQSLKNKKISNIILIGYGFEYLKFFKVLKSLNYSPLILSNLSFSNKKGQEIDNYSNKIVFDAPYFDLEVKHSMLVKNFIDKYKQTFNINPDFNAAYGYDSIKLINHIIEKKIIIKDEEKGKLMINGVSGRLRILQNGDSITELTLIEK